MIFEIFDNLEVEKPENPVEFISGQLEGLEFDEGMEHLAAQTGVIAVEVYEIYREDSDFRGDTLKEKPLDPKLSGLNKSLGEEGFPIDNF